MKFYTIAGILFLVVFYFQIKKDKELNDIFDNGITEKASIVDKTEDCLSATRNRNKATVITANGLQFEIPINYNDCIKFKVRDSLLIRYLDADSKAIRVYDFNKPVKENNLFSYIFLIIGIAFFITAFIKLKR